MTTRRVLATTALTMSVAVAFAPLATAQQQEPKLQMNVAVTGHTAMMVSAGPCKTFSTVTSPGFNEPITLTPVPDDPVQLRGTGAAVDRSGTYTATVQCDGKTLTAQFTVLPREMYWWLEKAEVEPGGKITAYHAMFSCRTAEGQYAALEPLHSPGFVAPLVLAPNLMRSTAYGSTTVITTPGVYEVVAQCQDRPERSVKTFRILGTPPAPPPPGTPKPKPPIVKPKGAPDTGGGGSA
jgi:hypothetical protein